MSGALEKSLAILEYLTQHPHGIALAKLSTDLNLPRSNCHRLLGERHHQRAFVLRGACFHLDFGCLEQHVDYLGGRIAQRQKQATLAFGIQRIRVKSSAEQGRQALRVVPLDG